jgi:hypothetical protein
MMVLKNIWCMLFHRRAVHQFSKLMAQKTHEVEVIISDNEQEARDDFLRCQRNLTSALVKLNSAECDVAHAKSDLYRSRLILRRLGVGADTEWSKLRRA